MAKEKSVLIVFDSLEYGGATRICQEFTKLIDEKNFILLSGFSPNTEHLKKEFKIKEKILFPVKTTRRSLSYLLFFINTFFYITKILLTKKIDIILLNLPYSSLGVVINPLSWNKKKIFIFHGAWDLEKRSLVNFFSQQKAQPKEKKSFNLFFEIKNKIHFLIQKFVLKNCSKIIAFSNYSKNLIIDHYKIRPEKIRIIPPPLKLGRKNFSKRISLLNLKKKYLTENVPLFLVPSRFEPRKGIHTLFEAIEILSKTKTKFRVVFTGDATYDAYYTLQIFELYRKKELFNFIEFIGTLERKRLYWFYQIADCVIMPSLDLETLGLVTLESLFFGTPVLGFKTGATPEILKKVDKRLIINNISPKSLAKKMEWFINLPPNEKEKIRQKCKKGYQKIVNIKKLKTFFKNL